MVEGVQVIEVAETMEVVDVRSCGRGRGLWRGAGTVYYCTNLDARPKGGSLPMPE